MRQSESDTRVGSQFGPYRLLRLLGRGGMGEVYEAEDTRKHRVVALKLISAQFSGDPVFRARMQREADAAGRLTEPHVVPIHDYGEIDGLLYLDMRLIDGTDLSTLLKRFGALSPPRAVAIVRQVAAALDAAHSSGVTHRDVKPENILITRDDFAYLLDFGIARAAADPQLTQTGVAMGSYHYMAPERFTDHDVTYRADIYSLTCVLLECLTGSPPYRTTSIERAVAAHLTEPVPRPSQLRPGSIPAALDEVIARGMAKNPEARYRSAGELAAAANDALTGSQQLQANTILRDGESATMHPNATPAPSPAADTLAGPVPAGGGGASRSDRSGPGPSMIRAAPTTSGQAYRPGPDFGRPVVPDDGKRRQWIIVSAIALVALVAFVVAVIGYLSAQPSTPASGQSVLPFNGIDFRLSPGGVALNKAGDVFVTNQGMYGRVVELASGSSTATVLPFTGLYQPQGLAVDSAGAVYVADFNNRVVKLAAGSNSQVVLPFSGLNYPEGVAVDGAGAVYVADRGNSRVVKLAAGSSAQDVLPFTGLKNPDGVAVDTAGNVFVTDTDNNRVLELAAGASAQTVLPFTGVSVPWGIAVDGAGNVYVTEHDSNKVMKLAAGSNTPMELKFTGLNTPLDVTVDNAGNVYVADRGNDRVVKLTP
ncbi:serine/threonine-protein kinase PknD [Mycobacterium mantenii]|uniref:non-specific serine/threonine protein kinase n=1 Tax=Mycobacterium mantenii TaxID=560555 RepID=A0A1A2SRP8_MYCNT|nr:serine/threonine-protein kinase PknD [Mycobacterium mantenii]OBH46903.1 serine/threonine protein kinase [Mycobacterium mantenii]OBH66442.1 serine/threonine protein kinase [Mycobacterium mantenii]